MLAPTSASTSPAYKVVSIRGAAEPSAHGRIVLSLRVYPLAWSVLLNKVDFPRCSRQLEPVKFSDAQQAWPLQVLEQPMLLGQWQACELGLLASDPLHSAVAARRCFEGLLETNQALLAMRCRLSAKVGRTL